MSTLHSIIALAKDGQRTTEPWQVMALYFDGPDRVSKIKAWAEENRLAVTLNVDNNQRVESFTFIGNDWLR